MRSSLVAIVGLLATAALSSEIPSTLSFQTTKATLLSTSAPSTGNFATKSVGMSLTNTDSYPDEAVISLPIGDEDLEIALEKSQLFAPNFHEKVLSFDPRTGAPIETDNTVMAAREGGNRNCYYHGHVKGRPNSIVALNTCNGGVSGMVSLENRMFSLERPPQAKSGASVQAYKSLMSSLSSDIRVVDVEEERKLLGDAALIDPIHAHQHQHNLPNLDLSSAATDADANVENKNSTIDIYNKIYVEKKKKDKDINDDNSPFPDKKEEDKKEQDNKVIDPRSPRWVEMVVISDKARVDKLGDNVSADTLEIMNNVAAYYLKSPTKHSIRIVLKGHYIFDKANPYWAPKYSDGSTQVTGGNGLLSVFLNYMNLYQNYFPSYDVAMLLAGGYFQSNIRGLANVGSVCSHKSIAGGVNSLVYRSNVFNSVLTAHETGHTLYANHDGEGNSCPPSGYVMGPYVGENTDFSTCSRTYFDYYLENSYCLYNNPHATSSALDATASGAAAAMSAPDQGQLRALYDELAERERGLDYMMSKYPIVDINKGRIEAYDAEHGVTADIAQLVDGPRRNTRSAGYDTKDLVITVLASVLGSLVLFASVLGLKQVVVERLSVKPTVSSNTHADTASISANTTTSKFVTPLTTSLPSPRPTSSTTFEENH